MQTRSPSHSRQKPPVRSSQQVGPGKVGTVPPNDAPTMSNSFTKSRVSSRTRTSDPPTLRQFIKVNAVSRTQFGQSFQIYTAKHVIHHSRSGCDPETSAGNPMEPAMRSEMLQRCSRLIAEPSS